MAPNGILIGLGEVGGTGIFTNAEPSNVTAIGGNTVDVSGLHQVDSAKLPAALISQANGAAGSQGLEIVLHNGTRSRWTRPR